MQKLLAAYVLCSLRLHYFKIKEKQCKQNSSLKVTKLKSKFSLGWFKRVLNNQAPDADKTCKQQQSINVTYFATGADGLCGLVFVEDVEGGGLAGFGLAFDVAF